MSDPAEVLVEFRRDVEAAGLRWREPSVTTDDDGCWTAEFFGSGGQGREAARFLLTDSSRGTWAMVVAREPSRSWDTLLHHVDAYEDYLLLNGWRR